MKDRIQGHSWRDSDLWNSVPGALSFDIDFADDVGRFPFHHDGQVNRVSENSLLPNFTAVIYVESGLNGLKSSSFSSYSNSPLFRLVKNVGKSRYVSKVSMKNENRIQLLFTFKLLIVLPYPINLHYVIPTYLTPLM